MFSNNIRRQRNDFLPLASFLSTIYEILRKISAVNSLYQFNMSMVNQIVEVALEGSQQTRQAAASNEARVHEIKTIITKLIFKKCSDALFQGMHARYTGNNMHVCWMINMIISVCTRLSTGVLRTPHHSQVEWLKNDVESIYSSWEFAYNKSRKKTLPASYQAIDFQINLFWLFDFVLSEHRLLFPICLVLEEIRKDTNMSNLTRNNTNLSNHSIERFLLLEKLDIQLLEKSPSQSRCSKPDWISEVVRSVKSYSPKSWTSFVPIMYILTEVQFKEIILFLLFCSELVKFRSFGKKRKEIP